MRRGRFLTEYNIDKSSRERQHKYQKMLIDESVMDTYKKKEWGSKAQRYNEHRKIRYNWKKKLTL